MASHDDDLDDDTLQQIYTWVDEIPLSRPKRNIARDFSDAVLAAEVVAHFFPKLVEMHNYSQANSVRQKIYNWQTLNQKVLKKLGMQLSMTDIEELVNCAPGKIESVLLRLQTQLAAYRARRRARAGGDGSSGSARGEDVPHSVGGGPTSARAAPSARGPDPPSHGPSAPRAGAGAHLSAAPPAGSALAPYDSGAARRVDTDILVEKEQTIAEYKETVQILELKIKKLEQLVRLKDSRIQTLDSKVQTLSSRLQSLTHG